MDIKTTSVSGTAFAQTRRTNQTSESKQPEITDGLVRTAAFEAAPQIQKFNGPKEAHGSKDRSQVGRNRLQDQGRLSSIGAAGAAGGLAASVATSQLHYPDGRWDLKALADKALIDNGLKTEYPPEVKAQVAEIMAQIRPADGVYKLPEAAKAPWVRDLTDKAFSSVDNGILWTKMDPEVLAKDPEANVQSKDLDQLQYSERLPNGDIKLFVAVSDVDAFVPKGSAIDKWMDENTSSIYTPDKIYNLVPKELAEDVVSLNPREERFATIVEYTVGANGEIKNGDVYQAVVKSRSKMDYASVGGWLGGKNEASPGMKVGGEEILEQIKMQNEAAQRLKHFRQEQGALEFESNEVRIITKDGDAVGVEKGEKNLATEMVENMMVSANEVMSTFLRSKGYPTMERVVAEPEKWDKIVELAGDNGGKLPSKPDGKALAEFLKAKKAENPEGYNELSFSVIKLIGRGEYQGLQANEPLPGHFGLAKKNYSQCTASIRRGGDRYNARNLKAALAGKPAPYSASEFKAIGENLTAKEQLTKKAERQADKSAVASMFETMLKNGEHPQFEAVVSGVKDKNVFVRIGNPPVEGKLQSGGQAKVGQKVKVELTSVNVEMGHINFSKAK